MKRVGIYDPTMSMAGWRSGASTSASPSKPVGP